jgi:hypothetical protein
MKNGVSNASRLELEAMAGSIEGMYAHLGLRKIQRRLRLNPCLRWSFGKRLPNQARSPVFENNRTHFCLITLD